MHINIYIAIYTLHIHNYMYSFDSQKRIAVRQTVQIV